MGPSQRCEKTPVVQDGSWRLGRRLCLLKGCERQFQPRHPLSRYCSAACRAAARRWHHQQANRRYRASEQGQVPSARPGLSLSGAASGHACSQSMAALCVEARAIPSRDGTAELSGAVDRAVTTGSCQDGSRSPLQKFCSAGCRQALRRVLIRERRWQRRLASRTQQRAGGADDFW